MQACWFSPYWRPESFLTDLTPISPLGTSPSLTGRGIQPGAGAWRSGNPSSACQEFRHSPAILDGYAPVDGGQFPAAQVNHRSHSIPSAGAGPDPSRAVQNPSGVCQGYETATASTLTASRIGLASDAHPALGYVSCLSHIPSKRGQSGAARHRVDSYTVCRFRHGGA